jgi:intracellular sulfur oxidation DsrE/DsrF family protein
MKLRTLLASLFSATLLAVSALPAVAQSAKSGVVLQVSDESPATWNQTLNVARNIQAVYGKDKVDVEIVVFGNGHGLLKFDSPLANRIDDALESGVQVAMCENTMKANKLTKADMHAKIGYVKAGVIEIIEKQKQGWNTLRP